MIQRFPQPKMHVTERTPELVILDRLLIVTNDIIGIVARMICLIPRAVASVRLVQPLSSWMALSFRSLRFSDVHICSFQRERENPSGLEVRGSAQVNPAVELFLHMARAAFRSFKKCRPALHGIASCTVQSKTPRTFL